MKFTLLAHPSLNGADRLLNKILSGADPADMRVSHIILVPDRCTLAAEKEALSLFGGSFSIQVLTMRRFASRILPEYRYIDKESAVLAVTGIAEKNRDKMKCFRGGRAYGFPDSVVEVIGQLKYSRISPEKMTCADLPGYLKNKVDDIRLIYTEYERFLSGGLKDSADRLTALMQAIPYSPLVADSHFYIKDFDNFSKQETEIISLLIKHSLSVTAAVAMCDFPSHSMIYLNEAFISLKNTVEKLESEGQLDPADVSFYFGSEMEERESFLFSYLMNANIARVVPKNVFPGISLYCAASETEEVSVLAEYIHAGVRAGALYSDFTVVTGNTAKYSSAIKNVFSVYGIPYFIDTKTSLSDHVAVRYLLSYLALRPDNLSFGSVMEFIKNPFFECAQEDKFAFEKFVGRYNQAYRLKEPFVLGKDSPWYEGAERTRACFMNAIKALPPEKADAETYIALAEDFIIREQLEAKAEAFALSQDKAGLGEEAARTRQVYKKLCRLLENAGKTLSGAEMTAEFFALLLTRAADSTEISVLPLTEHSVEIIPLSKARRHEYKHLCMLGACDGEFPAVKGDFGILSDSDLRTLALSGIEIEPSVRTLNERERFNVFQLFLENYDTLRVSYCSGKEGEGKAALAVRHLQRIFTENGKPFVPETRFNAKEKVILSRKAAEHFLKERVCAFMGGSYDRLSEVSPLYYALGCPDVKSLVYSFREEKISKGREIFLKDNCISVSRIETFFACPYRHFLQYGMRLQPEKNDIGAVDFGSIIHAVCEKFLRPYTDPSFSETDEQAEKRVSAVFAEETESRDFYRAALQKADTGSFLLRLKTECISICRRLAEQLKTTLFRPRFLEKRFTEKEPYVICDGDFRLRLTGVADRVDVWENNAVVIDYKTGKCSFSYDDLFTGKKLQLTVYAKAVENMGFRCAGFYYMSLREGYASKKEESKFRLVGQTLDEESILNAVDTEMFASGESRRLGFRLTSSGKPPSNFSGLADKELMKDMMDYTSMMMKKATEQFIEGNIAVRPLKDECRYCDFRSICEAGDTIPLPSERKKASAEDISEAVRAGRSEREL